MKITEALLAEHVVFHSFFDYLERTVPRLRNAAEVRALASLLEAMLLAHSDAEERLLFEPLEHYLEQMGQADTFEEEHREIDGSLHQAAQARVVKRAKAHLLGAVLASRKHFDKEERLVFPLAEKHLKARTLAELGRAWSERRKVTS